LKDDALIALIASVGEPGFAAQALAFINSQVLAEHLSLLAFDAALVPRVAGTASRASDSTAKIAGQVYERALFYRFDPNSERVRTGSADDDVMLSTLAAADIRDARYRSSIYGRFGIVERASLIRRVLGRWVQLNVYRDRASGRFEQAALAKLTEMGPLLIACTGKHLAQTSRPAAGRRDRAATVASFESMLQSLNAGLTQRERQVCAHALAGVTVAGIAVTLGVKDSTVATLRRRAYAKLGISSLNALFAMCVAHLTGQRSESPAR
jgi:DNA-binding CsgD family transcriptional regulator